MTLAYAQTAPEAPAVTTSTSVPSDAGAPPSAAAGFMSQFGALIMIFLVFYFLLIRPQQKRLKQHQSMISSINRGDKVVTGGGIVGTVERVIDENEVLVSIADNVTIKVIKSTLADVKSKSQPAAPVKKDDNAKEAA